MRIHELAKELAVKSKELIASLDEMGYTDLTASSSVPDEAVPRLRASGGKAVPSGKPKVVKEEPLPTRKPKPKPKPPAPKATPPPTPEEPPAPPPEPAPPTPAPAPAAAPPAPASDAVRIGRGATVKEIAAKLEVEPTLVIKKLLEAGEMVTITQSLPDESIELVADGLEASIEIVAPDEEEDLPEDDDLDPARMTTRPPVVTVMGHVDHGKTLLLDAIRKTDVISGEAGGITQAIGAYQVTHPDPITFIDTPGHEAFTAMRARGAQVTDMAVLVVAADDGVMPQTVEAINHAAAAGVPIVVAVNKVDKPEADPMRVRQQLAETGIQTSEWGGDYEFVDVSAKSGVGLDKLLETLLLVADLQELKADPDAAPRGVTIEAHLDKGRGPVATVLVQQGTLRVGDVILCGTAHGRVRAMFDEHAQPVLEAPPGKPVQVLGWSHVPEAGDEFRVLGDEKDARRVAQERASRLRAADLVSARPALTLQDIVSAAAAGEISELNMVLKADTRGSLEALAESLRKLSGDEVAVRVLHQGVGAIGEADVMLAQASSAIIVGFNVRPVPGANQLAEREGVDIRLYRVIYEAVDEIKQALSGLLTPGEEEIELGRAEVRATFQVPKVGRAAGCMVVKGQLMRNDRARLVRDGTVVYDGRIQTLRRFKDDVREVAEGFECGVGLEDFQDVKEGDIIEAYEIREVARSL